MGSLLDVVRHALFDQHVQRFDVVHAGMEQEDGLSGGVGLSDGFALRAAQTTDLSRTALVDESLAWGHDDRRGARVDRRRERHDVDFRGHRLGDLARQLADLLHQRGLLAPGQVGNTSTDHATNHRTEPRIRVTPLILTPPLMFCAAARSIGDFRQRDLAPRHRARRSAFAMGLKS